MPNFLKGYVVKTIDDSGILEVAVATDNSQDRDGEIVDPEGLDLTNFMKNPVLLWAHDYRSEPIGKIIEIIKEKNRVLFKSQFAVDISEKANQIYRLYKEGFLNAFSIGFIGKEREGNKFTKTELLEISGVPVPANANAVVLARGMKSFDDNLLKEMEKSVSPIEENLDASFNPAEQIKICGQDIQKLEDICAVKATQLLPHHDAVSMKAVWKGVSTAMAILLGAKGGIELTETERKEAYDHLTGHYVEFGKEAPEFKLVEAQVLKDVDFETDKEIIVNIVKSDNSQVETLKNDVESIKQSLAGANGKGAGGSEPAQRSAVSVVKLLKGNEKRLLQVIANSVSTALHAFKQLDDDRNRK